jgi:predicted MFS family arabinose efflux permease
VLGIVMAGVLTAVMLARPYSLFVASTLGWRAIYTLSACATLALGLLLWAVMPERRPSGGTSYLKTILSMFALFAGEHRVHRRTVYQALLFSAYTMFWATLPIMLAQHFGFSQNEIAVFALVGAGGVVAALLAGRWADRGSIRIGTLVVSLLLVLAFLGSVWAVHALMLFALVVAAILIDGAVQAAQTFSRLVVLESAPEHRGRVNALYMTIIYTAGALGSIIGVSVYVQFGWTGMASLGAVLALVVAILLFAEHPQPSKGG